ncbi:MAG: Ig domain-containing protein [Desulfatitalea sp.]|nr:Ig domain-containing protein [Desulfatitalea sp.]
MVCHHGKHNNSPFIAKFSIQVMVTLFAVLTSFYVIDCAKADELEYDGVLLSISEHAGVNRSAEPVTTGLPLPREADITHTDQLSLSDDQGNSVSAQFSVLSRWDGQPNDSSKPIKWVCLDFQSDFQADQTRFFRLKSPEDTNANAYQSNLSVSDLNDEIVVKTGKAQFRIDKRNFSIFSSVYIDSNSDGSYDKSIIVPSSANGIFLVDQTGKEYKSNLCGPEEIIIEDAGPKRATINFRGVLKSEDGSYFAPALHYPEEHPKFDQPYPHSFVYYNIRYHFYENQDYVKLAITIENNGANGRTTPEKYFAPAQPVYFDSLNLVLNTLPLGNGTLSSNGIDEPWLESDTFTLFQSWHENLTDAYKDTLEPVFENGIYYKITKNGQILSDGQTNPGWMRYEGQNGNIGLAIRNFWQNLPKKISFSPDKLIIGLWPEEGYYPYCTSEDYPDAKFDMYARKAGRDGGVYLFDAGRHKTYEIVLDFSGQTGNGAIRSKSLEYPLVALAKPEWYASSKVLGMIAPSGLHFDNNDMEEALNLFEQHQMAMVDPASDLKKGTSIDAVKTQNPPHWEYKTQNRFFNWMNFGDLLWTSASPSALHYDWTYGMLLHYLRTGERRFFDRGAEMARHRYDIDQYHGERSSTGRNHKWLNHLAFYESSGHSDPTLAYNPARVSPLSHTWNGGIALYYLLTGDRSALQAVEENTQGILNYYGDDGISPVNTETIGGDEIRMEGWSILNLINAYRINGNQELLLVAKNIAKNRLIPREQAIGGNGYWGVDIGGAAINRAAPLALNEVIPGAAGNAMWNTMYAYIMGPLIQIHYETQDDDIRMLLLRMAEFSKNNLLFGGDYNQEGKYRPLQSLYMWMQEDPDGEIRGISGEILKTAFFSDLFAYAHLLTGNSVYLAWAQKCFNDAMLYWDKRGGTYLDTAFPPSSPTFMDSMFASSHTKAHGWLMRTNQVFLYTMNLLGESSFAIISAPLPSAYAGRLYSARLQAFGGTEPYHWTVIEGGLPNGFSLDATSGQISGQCEATGAFPVTVKVTDSSSPQKEATYAFTINVDTLPPLSLGATALPEAVLYENYTYSIPIEGGVAPVTVSLEDGSLLPGSLNLDERGVLAGVPNEEGTFAFIVKATDALGQAATQTYSLVCNSPEAATLDPMSAFLAVPGNGQNLLSWTNPIDERLSTAVIVFRTDRFPESTTDGTELVTLQAIPGMGQTYTHLGTENETTYVSSDWIQKKLQKLRDKTLRV